MRTMTASAALAAVIALAGCASNPANKATVAADEPLRGYDAEIDWAYVAKVNRQARVRGVSVVWYHYPQKKPERAESR
jgi:hypothetical protein